MGYCLGNAAYTAAATATGAFQSITLNGLVSTTNTINQNFSNPVTNPFLNQCAVPTSWKTCTDLKNSVNSMNFTGVIDNSVSDKYKQCCQCLYSINVINTGTSSTGSSGSTSTGSTSSTGSPSSTSGGTSSGRDTV